MGEYITRDDAIVAVRRTLLEDVYSADVVEVKHGKWLLEYEPNGKPYCFHCSVCDGDFHYIDITTAYPFCPHCGAKMEVDG